MNEQEFNQHRDEAEARLFIMKQGVIECGDDEKWERLAEKLGDILFMVSNLKWQEKDGLDDIVDALEKAHEHGVNTDLADLAVNALRNKEISYENL